MKYFIVFVITLVLLAVYIYLDESPSPSTQAGRALMNQMARKLEKRHDMEQNLIDEAGDENTYTVMGLGFSIKRVLSKDEGRAIIVDCVNTFLSEINSNESFRKYMSVYPFTEENIDISLYVSNPDGEDAFYPNVGIFASGGDKISYYYDTPDNKYEFHSIERESFEEAAKIVASQTR